MPLYEYRCEACARRFEAYKRFTERSEDETCPSCGGRARRETISLFGARGAGQQGASCGKAPRRSPFG